MLSLPRELVYLIVDWLDNEILLNVTLVSLSMSTVVESCMRDRIEAFTRSVLVRPLKQMFGAYPYLGTPCIYSFEKKKKLTFLGVSDKRDVRNIIDDCSGRYILIIDMDYKCTFIDMNKGTYHDFSHCKIRDAVITPRTVVFLTDNNIMTKTQIIAPDVNDCKNLLGVGLLRTWPVIGDQDISYITTNNKLVVYNTATKQRRTELDNVKHWSIFYGGMLCVTEDAIYLCRIDEGKYQCFRQPLEVLAADKLYFIQQCYILLTHNPNEERDWISLPASKVKDVVLCNQGKEIAILCYCGTLATFHPRKRKITMIDQEVISLCSGYNTNNLCYIRRPI